MASSWLDLAELAQEATRAVFGEQATYDPPPGGSPVEVFVEFDASALQVELADGVAVQTVGPRASALLAELPGNAAAVGAVLVVREVSYTVTEIQPDGHGLVMLQLRRV